MTKREILQLDLPALRAQREAGNNAASSNGAATAKPRGARRWFAFGAHGASITPRQMRADTMNLKARLYVVLMILMLASTALIVRAVDLQWVSKDFYQDQGEQRYERDIPIEVPRGTIYDRNGDPLAVSTPVESIWADPPAVLEHPDRLPQLAKALGIDAEGLRQKLDQKADKHFVYLVRRLNPDDAEAIMKLNIPGVWSRREFRRFYPAGEITAHIIGKTDVDDEGQEGLELAFNGYLAGKPGSKSVIHDLKGNAVEPAVDVELDKAPQPGQDLVLSIDQRIQYLAYRELMQAIKDHHARDGSIIVMDVTNGEILAMVNQPSFNPNSQNPNIPPKDLLDHMRNRAVIDGLEPGSTMKAFTLSAALESGKWKPTDKVDTSPGYWDFQGHKINDTHNKGVLDLTHIITYSSNVGAAKVAMTLSKDQMYDVYHRFGLGESTGSGFPGESPGFLPIAKNWYPIDQAHIAYGYALRITPLQLATGYAAIANGGVLHQPTFVKGSGDAGRQVIDPKIAKIITGMLETVVSKEGTAPAVVVDNYSIAGKTGTSHIAVHGGYSDVYHSLFVGFIPASNPRLVCAVVITGATGNSLVAYAGGWVSGPSFAKIMQGSLRLLDIPPDNVKNWYTGGPGPNPLVLPQRQIPPSEPEMPTGETEGADP
jgi:cell division protein FtsI (penicillin-binding protein 3)